MTGTWRNKLQDKLEENGESWGSIISINAEADELTASDEMKQMDVLQLLDYELYFEYGGDTSINIIVWTCNYIYFSYEYDGYAYLESVPRNPTIKAPNYWRL